jgi:hypothetical protein
MLSEEKFRQLADETTKSAILVRRSAGCDELIRMFQALSLEDNETASDPMQIDEVERDPGHEKGCKIQATFEPIDIDQGAEAHIIEHYDGRSSAEGGIGLKPSQTVGNNITTQCSYNSQRSKGSSDSALAITSSWKLGSLIHPHESGPERFPGEEFGMIQKRNLPRVTYLTYRLAGYDALSTFADNYEKPVPDWIALLGETTLPSTVASSDRYITATFKAVDSIVLRR